MAIYNGRILMRKGNEADFDAEKLMAGEWAVSLDKGIVRICLEAGKVIRMATYEAFEEDMKQIEAILLECQTIEEAVRRINTEVNNKLNACAEYVQQAKGYSEQAKQYRDEALQFRNEAEEFAPEGYADLVEQVQENTVKVDTIIEKADLGIKETASGEEIHLIDSAEGKAVEFALYGKAKQNTTSGKNLLPNTAISQTYEGLSLTVNGDKSVTVSGNCSSTYTLFVNSNVNLKANTDYILNGCPSGGGGGSYQLDMNNGTIVDKGNGVKLRFPEDTVTNVRIRIAGGYTANNLVFKPMIRLAEVTDSTYEPYTNGASPNPSYPQEIEVSGESYNLLEVTTSSQTINGVEFVVNEDKSVTVSTNGETVSAEAIFQIPFTSQYTGMVKSSGVNDENINTYMWDIDLNQRVYADETKTSLQTLNQDKNNKEVYFYIEKGKQYRMNIRVFRGYSASGTVYPMIRKASVKNDRYMPFGVGSVEVKSVGKNLAKLEQGTLAHETTGGDVESDIRLRTSYVPIIPFTDYVTSVNNGLVIKNGVIYDKNKNRIVHDVYPSPTTGILNVTNSEAQYIRLIYGKADNSTVNPNDYKYQFEKGTVATEYVPYREPMLANIPTPNGLAGIKVSSGGNYTDQNGQQWICDEVVKYADGSGEYVHKIKKLVFDDSISFTKNGNIYSRDIATDRSREYKVAMCNNHKNNTNGNITNVATAETYLSNGEFALRNSGQNNFFAVYFKNTSIATAEDFKSMMLGAEMYYILADPIRTPLTAEEIAEISTFYPVTNISNDFDCGMKVKYNADSKNYIDKQLAEMERAREQAMMSMFLLLPEETQATMIENDVNNLLTESEN